MIAQYDGMDDRILLNFTKLGKALYINIYNFYNDYI